MAAEKIQVEVTKKFKDKRAKGKMRNVGEVMEVTERRLAEIQTAGDYVQVIEPAE